MGMHLQAVRRSKEAFKLQEDAQYGSSPFLPKQQVPFSLTLWLGHNVVTQTYFAPTWARLHLHNMVSL